MGLQVVHNAVTAGVDSIEHGAYIAPEDLRTMVAKWIYYVPTIYVVESVAPAALPPELRSGSTSSTFTSKPFRRAVAAGIKIAFGTDVGGFPWTVNPPSSSP